jgi:SAM-dependent methyltransferase
MTASISVITPTHDPKFIAEAWQSLRDQGDFEWVIFVNHASGDVNKIDALAAEVRLAVGDTDERVRVCVDATPFTGVGAVKLAAFSRGTRDVLVELDHDDLLTPGALDAIRAAFDDPEIGFVYSDGADFEQGSEGQGHVTYRHDGTRAGWIAQGFTFRGEVVGGVRPGVYELPNAFPATAAALSLIFYAPNHVRAWRRTVYESVGGHNPQLTVADDHELMVRTYLATKMKYVPKLLYLYRVTGANTWLQNVVKIQELTFKLRDEYLERLVLRECELLGMPAYDLGGGIDPRAGWLPVDLRVPEGNMPGMAIKADLMQPWPFEDNSVGAFRAHDLLEHLPDKMHTMREIHRCLRPGGWLLSMTPSTDGRGAFQDPTHVSYYNQNSFWYWTRREQARYIDNTTIRFQAAQLDSIFPSKWHADNNIPYVRANLVALKDGYAGPGEQSI